MKLTTGKWWLVPLAVLLLVWANALCDTGTLKTTILQTGENQTNVVSCGSNQCIKVVSCFDFLDAASKSGATNAARLAFTNWSGSWSWKVIPPPYGVATVPQRVDGLTIAGPASITMESGSVTRTNLGKPLLLTVEVSTNSITSPN